MGVLLDGVLRVHLDSLDHEPDVIGLTVAVEVWKDLKVGILLVTLYNETTGHNFTIPLRIVTVTQNDIFGNPKERHYN